MDMFIVFFLAHIWACIVAPAVAASGLRGRGLKVLVDVCMNLSSSRYGGHGKQTITVPKEFRRWMIRDSQGGTSGPCSGGSHSTSRQDESIVNHCRRFGGKKNGVWRTVQAPRFMDLWFKDHQAKPGSCTGRLFRGSTIRMSAGGTSSSDDNNLLCMDIEGDLHTVEVSDEKYDWFSKKAEYEGECEPEDETSVDGNQDRGDYCVKIQNSWYNVNTDIDEDWWMEKTNRFEDDSCDSEDSIEMFYA